MIRFLHQFAKRYDIAHHHILVVWGILSLLIPLVALTATLGLAFSSIAQALSLFVSFTSIGLFFFILLLAEEQKILDTQHGDRDGN